MKAAWALSMYGSSMKNSGIAPSGIPGGKTENETNNDIKMKQKIEMK